MRSLMNAMQLSTNNVEMIKCGPGPNNSGAHALGSEVIWDTLRCDEVIFDDIL